MSEPAALRLPARPSEAAGRPALPYAGAALVGLALSAAELIAVIQRGWFSDGGPYDGLAATVFVLTAPAALGGGIALRVLRPRNRSGILVYGLGVVEAVWSFSAASQAAWLRYVSVSVLLLRPLLFAAVLAWPVGRLSRSDRRWLACYGAALGLCWSIWILVDPTGASAVPPFHNHLAVVDLPRLSTALAAFAENVVMPAGAIVLIVTVVRRYRRLPAAARVLGRPALAAGIIAGGGDLVLVLVDRYFGDLVAHGNERTLLGGLLALADGGRFVAVPLLLVWAVVRSRRSLPASRLRTVEVGPAAARVQDAIASALGDETVRVAYHRGEGWFDADGLPIALGGPGRHVTIVERAGEPIAAVDHDDSFDDRPTTVEIAVAAAASSIEHDRLAALARSRLREASDARRTIVDVEDAARRRIERDLHDGAQQRLVGLALQASLAERSGQADVGMLQSGVAEAREELRELASGVLPSILAERGLSAAIATLAATSPLAVDLQVSFPATLPVPVAATAWFVVAEAIANAVKHAAASALRIEGGVAGGWLAVSVEDDGVGGATVHAGSGLRGLAERARAGGGRLVVDSRPGAGTRLRLDLPIGS